MKTLYLSATLSATVLFGHAKPVSASDEVQLMHFATCAGRLSALMEYQWMFDGPSSETTAQQRRSLIELIEAIMPPDQGQIVLHWRLSAKHAQFALLKRATFNDDAADAEWATQTADRLTRECTSLLLS